MALPPTQLTPLHADDDQVSVHVLSEHRVQQYQREIRTLSETLATFKKNAIDNQKNYDAIYRLLYYLQREKSVHRQITRRTNKRSFRNLPLELSGFIALFNDLFDVDSTRLIYLNQPRQRCPNRGLIHHCAYSTFWDEQMRDLFAENEISFAPIETNVCMRLFAKCGLRSAGMIPFKAEKTSQKKASLGHRYLNKKKPSSPALFVFGSRDGQRFLPNSYYHVDLLSHLRLILQSITPPHS